MPLKAGGYCLKDHFLVDESAIYRFKKLGRPRSRCKQCHAEVQRNIRRDAGPFRPRVALQPGSTCRNNHFIVSMSDLIKNGKNRAMSCKQCKMAAGYGTLKSDLDQKKRYRHMLERGRCSRGHIIASEKDVMLRPSKRTPEQTHMFCKACWFQVEEIKIIETNEIRAESKSHKLCSARRHVELDCGHSPMFEPPTPQVQDIIYCGGCRNYRVVKAWGKIVWKEQHDGAESSGRA